MSTGVVIILFSVGAVLLFVVAMSLTLMIKGHYIDGEISTNRHMRARGITCAVADAQNSAHNKAFDPSRGDSAARHAAEGSDCGASPCAAFNCAGCAEKA